MSEFIQRHYYELQFAAVFGGMFLLFILEGFIPRREALINQTGRWLNNISLAVFNHFLLLFYSLGLGFIISRYQPESTLIEHFKLSDIGAFILLVFLFDFITYWLHRFFHKYPLLWRIHAVHHSDTEIDVTTSHRHHPFESMINGIILTPLIIILGIPVIVIAMQNFLHTFIALFAHGNIVLPEKVDSILRKFIVTPDFHRMHHSSDKKFTDSNYSVMFPLFDYIFGSATRKPYAELDKMELGLESMRSGKDSRVDRLLLTPFTYKSGSL